MGRNLSEFISVAEDLEHLRDEWWNDPSDAVVRRGSAILRRFLVDGVLQQVWKAAGFEREPTVIGPCLEDLLGPDYANVEVALAGGAHTGGIYVAGAVINRGSTPHENPNQPQDALEHRFGLGAYADSAAACAGGELVARRDVVKYFANVLAGVHLQRSSRVRKKEEDLVRRLKRIEDRVRVHRREGLFFELLSIGQCVGRSEDAGRLIVALRATP